MIRTTLKIEGMVCPMCESHINDVIRRTAPVKRVTSSRKKGETEILSEKPLDLERLSEAIGKTGYTVVSRLEEPYETKRPFRSGR